MKECPVDGKPVTSARATYCSARCANRAKQIRKYGITPEEYRDLTASGKCAICDRNVRRWNLDHDHKTHELRGAICGTCNKRLLTSVRNDAKIAFRLLEYLVDPPARSLEGAPKYVGAEIKRRDKRGGRFF